MAKYRKRPVVIEAEQWHPGKTIEGLCFQSAHSFAGQGLPVPHVHTLEGLMAVSAGDWIITGVAGERYPCKPHIFEQTYEPVEG